MTEALPVFDMDKDERPPAEAPVGSLWVVDGKVWQKTNGTAVVRAETMTAPPAPSLKELKKRRKEARKALILAALQWNGHDSKVRDYIEANDMYQDAR